ncbi:hypothetical protein [Muricoccus radiodurans]|uniref:hypothetical protein n=1 Tax=Muricoccus radiodurans TaxID=2231721 RepID=UPI003CEE85D8
MADTELHAKLDRILAGQAAQAKATAELETAVGALVQGVSGLVPLLGTQTEMLEQILRAATREPPGDMDLTRLLTGLLAALERIEAAVAALPAELRTAARGAA